MTHLKNIKESLTSVIGDGHLLIIVPPFGSISDIALGPHILQALAQKKGYKTDILYLSLLLASHIGLDAYNMILESPNYGMLGERMFARSAYGLPPLGKHPEFLADEAMSTRGERKPPETLRPARFNLDLDELLKIENMCFAFVGKVVSAIAEMNYRLVGCSAMMEQVNCSIALLNGIKTHAPDKITLLGGGNCEEDLAEGSVSLSPYVDYVFSGESETTFVQFLEDHANGTLPPVGTIITGQPLQDLDSYPLPDYDFFFRQYRVFFNDDPPGKMKIWYETSRGCWWADKSKCNYCGIVHNEYRQKSIDKVCQDIENLGQKYPGKIIYMVDSVIPRSFHKDLIPKLIDEEKYPGLGFQVRAHIDLKGVVEMKKAKIDVILPGIESYSSGLLKLMRKGIDGKQNLLFMRNARSAGIFCDWLMLSQFPCDKISDYYELLELLPLIRHLQPPRKLGFMFLMRFSPFFENRDKYHITNVRPWAVHDMIYPDWARKDKLASYYSADFPCEAHDHMDVIKELDAQVELWKKSWKKTSLVMKQFMEAFIIYDNRDIHPKSKTFFLDYPQAMEVMTSRKYDDSPNLKWAVEEKLGIVVDSWYVPLVIAPTDLLLEFEKDMKQEQKERSARDS